MPYDKTTLCNSYNLHFVTSLFLYINLNTIDNSKQHQNSIPALNQEIDRIILYISLYIARPFPSPQ